MLLLLFSYSKKKLFFIFFACLSIGIILSTTKGILEKPSIPISSEVNEELKIIFKGIIDTRNAAILNNDQETLELLYNREVRNGLWAFEHELKKMRYLHSWEEKQGISYNNIDSRVVLRHISRKNDGYTANLMVTTRYEYTYEDSSETKDFFQIGTYHSLDLMPVSISLKEVNIAKKEDLPKLESHQQNKFLAKEKNPPKNKVLNITREWYTDPFADSLNMDKMENQEIKEIILSADKRQDMKINEKRKKALQYADEYCGAACLPEYNPQYNPDYRNYNYLGGDCANFASQVLYEGGEFPKDGNWSYYRGSGSSAWVNAAAFNNYMIYSGRASMIAHGSYNEILEASYKLLPGDYIAYEKKGKVCHISVVSGADSKGYTLVNSHNTDRYRVPWDLGWSNRNIKFRLVQVHY